MNLDRFTQKAQEAVVAAQRLAETLQSPLLDAEHLLAALLEPEDGVPAETLRRLGVDLPGTRGELAALLSRRARIQGGSLTLGPRAKQAHYNNELFQSGRGWLPARLEKQVGERGTEPQQAAYLLGVAERQ